MKSSFNHIKSIVTSCLKDRIKNYSEKKYLLGVSSGADSVLLALIFHELKLNFSIAHVNYNLRGKESIGDAAFVKKFATKLKSPFFAKSVRAKKMKKKNESVQMLARDIRFSYFNEIISTKKIDYIVLAHHAGDQVETVLMNLFRGSGIKGLCGMNELNGNIFRPFLSISKKEILNSLDEKKQGFRIDSSNKENYYKRNYVRNEIVPMIEVEWPGLEETFVRNIENFRSLQKMLEEKAKMAPRLDFTSEFTINRKLLREDLFQQELFFTLAADNKFDILSLRNLVRSNSNETKYLKGINGILEFKGTTISHEPFNIKATTPSIITSLNQVGIFHVDESLRKTLTERISVKKIKGKISIRKWVAGDKMIPLGMKSEKKISDILTDLKLSSTQKKEVYILCDQEKPLWLIGLRLDNRVKLDGNEKAKGILTLNLL